MRSVTFWTVFDTVATRFADRTAVGFQRADRVDTWSYRELRANALARAATLSLSGVGAGDRCAILADNGPAWCAAYLGILRLGAVAVPLDTNYSPAQVATIVRDAAPRVVFAGSRLAAVAREALAGFPDVALLDLDVSPTGDARAALPDVSDRAEDPAVILYTSGTTADPKGVVLSHGNLLAERDAALTVVSVSEHDSVLGVLPLFHALAQLANLLLPFAVGARVVFLETVNSTELVRALADHRVTVFACVPQFFYLIHERVMREVDRAGMLRRVVFRMLLAGAFRLRRAGVNIGPLLFRRVHAVMGPQIRLFVTGGSKFDPSVGRDLYALGFTILQAYGLTETSGAATITRPDEAHLDTAGRALPGQEVSVRPSEDPSLDGEIAIRGPIVMQCYFNRPDATAAVMRDGWFLTGDLGRLDAQGRLTITGRKKEVIVLASGKNVYPEEIEAHYTQSEYIKEICVVGITREDEPTTERLFGVVVPELQLMRERRIANAGDLLRFEMEGHSVHLPPHKRILGYEVSFEPLPRTTTGKLKRHEIRGRLVRASRETDAADADVSVHGAWAGDSHAMAAVAVIVRRAKGAAVAPRSNLELDLGLDSMERVELITELEQRFATRVPEDVAACIMTVGELVDAFRQDARTPTTHAPAEDSWAVLLRDLPSPSDPVLGSLLDHRRLAVPLLFVLTRLFRLLMPRLEVSGLGELPTRGPYILTPNHQAYLDPFLICSVLPYRVFRQLFFVGAAEYFQTPLTRWLARQCNCVAVDPDANLVPAMKAGAFGLHHGKILMLFPEGERSIDGTVKRFKKGAAILSRHLEVPVVPVAIRGAYAMWPRNRPIAWRLLRPWSGHCVRIAFAAGMRFTAEESHADAAAALRQRVVEMWDELGDESEQPTRLTESDAANLADH
jgi:long-chain acyl-CoA synthetase